MTVSEIAAVARRGAISLANDPAVKHYSTATLALVYERTVSNVAGAGDLGKAADRISADPALKGVPDDVLDVLVAASFKHFARAFAGAPLGNVEPQ